MAAWSDWENLMIAAKTWPYPWKDGMRYYFYDQLEPETQTAIEVARELGDSNCHCHPHPTIDGTWGICEYHKGYDAGVVAQHPERHEAEDG